jgi:O-methyltransferase domain
MTEETAVPPHAAVLEMATHSILARTLFAVIELGVPDLLADGPLTAGDLAEKTGTIPDVLSRVLRTLATAGYFRSEGERYALTELGRTLTSGHPTAARELVLTQLGPWFTGALQQLPETLRTGRTGTELAFGMPIFEYLAQKQNASVSASFNRLMLAFHGMEPAAVARAWDLPEAEHIVDVGGGVATLLRTVLEHLPAARGTLFDQSAVIAEVDLGSVRDRCEAVAGDFFTSVPQGGNVYLLSHIIHDWDDEAACRILTNCRKAMAEGGRVILVESVLPPAGDDDHPSTFSDLIMLSIAGGRERTEEQYRDLLAAAGFDLVRVLPTDSAVSMIEAVPSVGA